MQRRQAGYLCNLSRGIVFEKVKPAMEVAQRLVTSMVETLAPDIRPCTVASGIRRKELEMFEGTGYKPVVPYTGHGVGRAVHGPPYLYEKDSTVLEPGMVATLEPIITFTSSGDLNSSIADQYVSTEPGNECLTTGAPQDIHLQERAGQRPGMTQSRLGCRTATGDIWRRMGIVARNSRLRGSP